MSGTRRLARSVTALAVLVLAGAGVGVTAPAQADTPTVTITSPSAGSTVSGAVGFDFTVTAPVGQTVTSIEFDVFGYPVGVPVTVPDGGCVTTCALHVDVPTSDWKTDSAATDQTSNLPDGNVTFGPCVRTSSGQSSCPSTVTLNVDNARPLLTPDPTGLPAYEKAFLTATSPTAVDSYTFGYTSTAAPGHESDTGAQPATVVVRESQATIGSGTVDGTGHGTVTWDTHDLPDGLHSLFLQAFSVDGAPSLRSFVRVTVDHGQTVSVLGVPTDPVPYGWPGTYSDPLKLHAPFGPADPSDPTGCPTTSDTSDSTYVAELRVSIDDGQPLTQAVSPEWLDLATAARDCWEIDTYLGSLIPPLGGGHHTIRVSETDNRGLTSTAPTVTVDVQPAPATLALTGPSVITSGATTTLTAQLSSQIPVQGVPVTFSFAPRGSSYQDMGSVVTDATGKATFSGAQTQTGTWRATTSATSDLPSTTSQVTVSADSAAPRVVLEHAGPAVRPVLGTTAVTFVYAGTDDVQVASYDVAVRKASLNTSLGAWAYPGNWQRLTAHSVSTTTVSGGQVCFAVRARDLVGHVSPWSPMRCTALPVDDRALHRSATGTQLQSVAGAIGGTVTRLTAGGTLQMTSQVDRHLGLCVYAGPGQGTVDVYVGTIRVARVSTAASTWGRRVVIVPAGKGPVTIRGVAGSNLIDGLAVLRD